MALGWPAFSRLFARNRATQLSFQSNLEKFVISSRYSKSKSNSIQSIVINILSDCFLRRKFFERSISRQQESVGRSGYQIVVANIHSMLATSLYLNNYFLVPIPVLYK